MSDLGMFEGYLYEPEELDQRGDFTRGLGNYIPQFKGLVGAGEAVAGEGLRRTLGEGAVNQFLIEDGLRRMEEAKAQQSHRPTDEFDVAAKQGLGGLIDWAQYNAGNLVGNVGEMAIASLAGAGVGGLIARKALKEKLTKEALKIAKERGVMGGRVASAVNSGVGSVGGRAIDEQGLENIDMGKVAAGSAAHAGLEFVGDRVLLGGMKGAGGTLAKWADDGITKALAKNVGSSMGTTALKEGATEIGQSGIERAAADLEMTSPDAYREYLNSGAAGAAMGGIAGGIGGVKNTVFQPAEKKDLGDRAFELGQKKAQRDVDNMDDATALQELAKIESRRTGLAPEEALLNSLGLSGNVTAEDVLADDAKRNEAAGSMATRILSDPNAPDTLRQSAQDFMQRAQSGDSTAHVDFTKALNAERKSATAMEKIGSLLDKLGVELPPERPKANAMTPVGETAESEVDASPRWGAAVDHWMENNLVHTKALNELGARSPMAKETVLGIADWAARGFPNFKRIAPNLIDTLGYDAARHIQSLYDYAVAEGKIKKSDVSPEKVKAVTSVLSAASERAEERPSKLRGFVLPSVTKQVSDEDVEALDSYLSNYATSKVSGDTAKQITTQLKNYFGENLDDVLGMYRSEAVEAKLDEAILDESSDNLDDDNVDGNDFSGNIQERKGSEIEALVDTKDNKGELKTATGAIQGRGLLANVIGVWDRVKQDFKDTEMMRDKEDELVRQLFPVDGSKDELDRIDARLKNEEDRQSILRYLNKRYKVVESLPPSEKELVDLTKDDLKQMQGNKNKHALVFTTTEGKEVVVSPALLVKRMRDARDQGAFEDAKDGELNQAQTARLLRAGIASVMQIEGVTGQVSYIIEGQSFNKMPDNFAVFKTVTGKSMREGEKAESKARQNKTAFIEEKVAENDAPRITKQERKVDVVDDFGNKRGDKAVNATDDQGNFRAASRTTFAEEKVDKDSQVSENTLAAEADEYPTVNRDTKTSQDRDELGADIPNRDTRPVVGKKQIDYLKNLLTKGVPAAVKAIKEMTEQKRFGVLSALRELVNKEFQGELKTRAQAVLKQLDGAKYNAQTTAQSDEEIAGEFTEPTYGIKRGDVRAVQTQRLTASQRYGSRIAGIFGKRVVYLEKLEGTSIGFDGVSRQNSFPSVIFVDAHSEKTPRFVVGHELLHHLEKSDKDGFAKLKKSIEPLLDQKEVADLAKEIGPERFEGETVEEAVANLVADYVYRNVIPTNKEGLAEIEASEKGLKASRSARFSTDLDATDKTISAFLNSNKKASAQSPVTKTKLPTKEEQQAVIDSLAERLGDKVKVSFWKLLKLNNEAVSGKWTRDLIKISLNAQDINGVADHESMHQFFSWLREHGATEAREMIERLAANGIIRKRVTDLLEGHPEAIKQLSDPEEFAAYVYQFWRAGRLELGPKTQTFFQKIAQKLKDMLGWISEESKDMQQVEEILQAFDGGAFRDGNKAVIEALEKDTKAQLAKRKNSNKLMQTLTPALRKAVYSAQGAFEDSKNPYLKELGEWFNTAIGSKLNKQAFLEAKAQTTAHYLNKLTDMLQGIHPSDLKLVSEALLKRERPKDAAAAKVFDKVQDYLKGMHEYMITSGVKRWDSEKNEWVEVGKVNNNFFPRVFNTEKIAEKQHEFVQQLLKTHQKQLELIAEQANKEVKEGAPAGEHTASLKALKGEIKGEITAEDIAMAITHRIIQSAGAIDIEENTGALGMTPQMRSVNKRTIPWLDDKAFADYMSQDVVQTLSSYTVQAVKRAEYTKRFGNDGEALRDQMDKALVFEMGGKKLVDQAGQELPAALKKWKGEYAKAIMSGVDKESLPEKPTLRKLALALLREQQVKDGKSEGKAYADVMDQEIAAMQSLNWAAKGVMAMEGSLGHDINPNTRRVLGAVTTYQNWRLLSTALFGSMVDPLGMIINGAEMKDVWAGFKRGVMEIKARWKDEKHTDELSKIAEDVGTVDAGNYLDALGQTYSSLFMYGKLKSWNDTLFKWNGLEAWNRAMRIQATGAAMGFISKHLKNPSENGKRYLENDLGLDTAQASSYFNQQGELDTTNTAVRTALMRWVDSAIVKPNAALRPIVASDPHYALFYHLKSFTYGFHRVILKRVMEEAKHGNYTPALQLVSTYPIMMIAADAMKEMIIPGDEPAWMKSGVAGALGHGLQRSSLATSGGMLIPGIPGMYADNVGNLDTSLFGPAVDQVADMFLGVPLSEDKTFIKEALGALPLGNLARRAGG